MDAIHESEQSSVYHAVEPGMKSSGAAIVTGLCEGNLPRLFALVREDLGEDDTVIQEVVAYGVAMPNGSAVTIPAAGESFGRWISPDSASRRLYSDLVWLAP